LWLRPETGPWDSMDCPPWSLGDSRSNTYAQL
jgi:hypothetical protein